MHSVIVCKIILLTKLMKLYFQSIVKNITSTDTEIQEKAKLVSLDSEECTVRLAVSQACVKIHFNRQFFLSCFLAAAIIGVSVFFLLLSQPFLFNCLIISQVYGSHLPVKKFPCDY